MKEGQTDLAQQLLRGSYAIDKMRSEISQIINMLLGWTISRSVESQRINKDWERGHFWTINNRGYSIGLYFTFEVVRDRSTGATLCQYTTLNPDVRGIPVEHVQLIHNNLHRLVVLLLATYPDIERLSQFIALMKAGKAPSAE